MYTCDVSSHTCISLCLEKSLLRRTWKRRRWMLRRRSWSASTVWWSWRSRRWVAWQPLASPPWCPVAPAPAPAWACPASRSRTPSWSPCCSVRPSLVLPCVILGTCLFEAENTYSLVWCRVNLHLHGGGGPRTEKQKVSSGYRITSGWWKIEEGHHSLV